MESDDAKKAEGGLGVLNNIPCKFSFSVLFSLCYFLFSYVFLFFAMGGNEVLTGSDEYVRMGVESIWVGV